MKAKLKLLALFLCTVLVLSVAGACANKTKTVETIVPDPDPLVEKPAATEEVRGVTIKYGAATVSGTLSVNLSLGSVELDADVAVTGNPTYALAFASGNTQVASVSGTTVQLLQGGESVITATAGGKEHQIVLVVADDTREAPSKAAITVVGGTASVTSAEAGEYVTLEAAAAPRGSKFVEWEYSVSGLWINGNILKMPAQALTVTAKYEKLLFSLSVSSATVSVKRGEDDIDVPARSEDGKTELSLYYDDEVTLVADPVPTGKTIAGWDRNAKNARVYNAQGEMERNTTIAFRMPDAIQTYEAIYSTTAYVFNTGFAGVDTTGNASTVTCGANPGNSTGGTWTGTAQTAVPEFAAPYINTNPTTDNARPGARFNISGTAGAGTHNRLRGSLLNNIRFGGAVTVTYVFQNTGNYDLTFDLVAESYGALASTGTITVPKSNGIVVKTIVVPHGFVTPYYILVMKEAVGGTGTVPLFIYGQQSATYPEYDPQLEVRDTVTVGAYNAGAGEQNIQTDNVRGITLYYGLGGGTAARAATVSNLPVPAEDETTTVVYFRVIGYSADDNTYKFMFGTGSNNDTYGSKTVKIPEYGTEVFAIRVTRPTSGNVVFTFAQVSVQSRVCFLIQMSYSNVFGVAEEDI